MTVLYETRLPGLRFQVFSSHVAVVDRRGCTGPLMPRKISIPMRNITGVELRGNKLTIMTSDEKRHKFSVLPGQAQKLQNAILQAMNN